MLARKGLHRKSRLRLEQKTTKNKQTWRESLSVLLNVVVLFVSY